MADVCTRCHQHTKETGRGKTLCADCKTRCSVCGVVGANLDNRTVCGDCRRAKMRRYHEANKQADSARSKNWRDQAAGGHHRGFTAEAFDALLLEQGGRCAACGTSEPGGVGRFEIDHDHSCCPSKKTCCGQCIRGLLCRSCNWAAGLLHDDPKRMKALAEYIERGGGGSDR